MVFGSVLGIIDPVVSDGAPTLTTVVFPAPPHPVLPVGTRGVFIGDPLNEVSIAGDIHTPHVAATIAHSPITVSLGTSKIFVGPTRVPVMTTWDSITGVTACSYPKIPLVAPTFLESPKALLNRVFVGITI
jgi:hypothetical protein